MKHISCIFCLLLALGSVMSCTDIKTDGTNVKLVTAEEMQSILDQEDAQLVDLRTPKEHDELRIANSQNIDFNSPTFDEDIKKLDKDKPVILYCRTGRRSAICAQKLKEAGFKKIYDLEGGISKWKHADILDIEEKS